MSKPCSPHLWRLALVLCWLPIASLASYAQSTALPSAGMLLWLKADALGAKNGDSVTVWRDAGSSGRQALFTLLKGKGVAPTYVENVFNGKPAVRFAGNSLLRVNNLPLGRFTIAAVFSTSRGGEMLYQHSDSAHAYADAPFGCYLSTGTKSTLSVRRDNVQTDKDITGEHAAAWEVLERAPVVAVTTFDGTDDGLQLYLNGWPQTLDTTAAGGLNSEDGVTMPFDIGARAAGGDMQFHGDLAELVIYDHVLPEAARRLLTTALLKKYRSALTFTDPTQVNLLEQWNNDGSYALNCTSTAGDPTNAVAYASGGGGWVVGNSQAQPDDTISARFTFPQPVVLGQVMVQWRVDSHAPRNYTFRDQNGVIVTDTKGPYDGQPRVHTFAPRTCEYLEISSHPAGTAVNVFEIDHLGAYLAKGQVLPMTGTTNILFEETGKMTVTGSGYDPSWISHSTGMTKPASEGGNMTLHLSREYELLGAFLSQYDSSRYMADARIEISRDGAHWTTVFQLEKYHFRGEPAPRDKGYITWDVPPNTNLNASWVRLSWGPNNDPVEITQFQLFGR